MSFCSLILGLGLSIFFALLLAVAGRDALRLRGVYRWLVALVALLLAGNTLRLAGESPLAVPASLYLYSAALVVTGALILSDLKRPGRRIWLIGGGLWWLALVGSDLASGSPMLGHPDWIATGLGQSPPDLAITLALAGWSAGGLLLLALPLTACWRAHLPEVANRALFWALVVPLLWFGLFLAAGGTPALISAGWITAFSGALGAAYGVSTQHPFHVRQAIRRGMGLLAVILITAAVILLALLVASILTRETEGDALVLVVVALAAAAFYVPLRELAGWVLRRVFSPAADAAPALRLYGQQITTVIDLEQVIHLAVQTLSRVLDVRSGGVVLASFGEEGRVMLEPAPAGDSGALPARKGQLGQKGALYHRLFVRKMPLLQYDLEFGQAYAEVSAAERDFFTDLRMSAYAPIIVDGRTIGLLAGGAKCNDEPYYAADLETLATIASYSGFALRNARLVTDLRRLNKQLEMANVDFERLDRVKTDFITIASHELRTPLAQVRGYADILESLSTQGVLQPEQMSAMMHNLRKASERMEELISDMLDVSKIDVDALDFHFAPATLEAIVRMAIDPLTEAIRARKLSLSARGLRQLSPIEADMQRLVQAFRNIIVNAVKYTPDGGLIDIRAEMEPHPDGPGTDSVHIAIKDTGIGIDPANQELVFEKFYRTGDPSLHSSGATKFLGAGPGLGLTIARGIVEGHGGRIWVESAGCDMEKLPGSTFHVVLPVRPPAEAYQVTPFEVTRLSISAGERREFMEQVQRAQADLKAEWGAEAEDSQTPPVKPPLQEDQAASE